MSAPSRRSIRCMKARRRRDSWATVTLTPNASPLRLSTYDFNAADTPPRQTGGGTPGNAGPVAGGRGGRGGGGFGGGNTNDPMRPRVILSFPSNANDMLLSGTLAGGEALSNRAQVVDAPLGKGHVVMFAIRPFWRWQTQGTFFLGFNAILNWNDLDAGKPARTETAQ